MSAAASPPHTPALSRVSQTAGPPAQAHQNGEGLQVSVRYLRGRQVGDQVGGHRVACGAQQRLRSQRAACSASGAAGWRKGGAAPRSGQLQSRNGSHRSPEAAKRRWPARQRGPPCEAQRCRGCGQGISRSAGSPEPAPRPLSRRQELRASQSHPRAGAGARLLRRVTRAGCADATQKAIARFGCLKQRRSCGRSRGG